MQSDGGIQQVKDWGSIVSSGGLIEKISEFKNAFTQFDKDRDGRIATKDLGKVVHSLGQDPAGINFKEVIQGLDLKDKKTIDLLEFLAVMTILRPDLLNQEQLEGFIQSLDMDEKCSVGAKELKKVMSDLDKKLPEADIDTIIREAGVDSDGRVSFERCIKLIGSK